MKSGVLLVLAVVTALCVPPAAAQETEVIHFQGMLTGPDGGPLRTDTYNVNFSIWDHATDDFDPLWSETQTVEVNEGLFDVFLGDGNPLSPDVFTPDEGESELRFLEIQVEGDDPMTPRLQMGKIPNSFVSSRVLGDIETNEGSLVLKDGAGDSDIVLNADGVGSRMIIEDNIPDENRAVEIIADGVGSRLIIEDNMPGGNRAVEIGANHDDAYMSLHLTDTYVPVMDIRGNVSGTSFEMSGYEAGQQIGPLLGLSTDALGANFAMGAPAIEEAGLEIINPIIEMITDASGGNFKINWTEPLDVPSPAVEMAVDNTSGAANFRLTQPLDVPAPAIEMNASNDFNSIFINWTQPLDIPSPAIEMMANGTNNSLAINWTQPLDMPSPAIEMNADDVMSNFTMNWTQPLDMPSPAIAMSTAPTSGATYRMFQPQPEPPGQPIIEFNTGIEGGGSIRMFQPQPEPPGSDPIIEMLVGSNGGNFTMYGQQALLQSTPFFEISSYSSGADMKFFESAGGTTVELNSGGDVIAQRGTFGQNNTNNGTAGFVSGGNNSLYASYSAIVGGYENNVTTAAEYSCLVGVDATLSADSTFMVDMPHIRFGDETDGYEFPTEDGRPNQMLATDGNGQLSWIDVTLLADENTNRLIEENRELKNLIAEFERRITELEER